MQPVGPYQFIEAISLCPVGSVWSAIDGQGNSYTVAVLDAAVAGDQRWRDAFTGTAHALAQPGASGPRYAHADFATPAPWVAYANSDGSPGAQRLFAALGMECRPMQSEFGDGESATVKTPAVGAPAGGADDDLATPTTRLTPGTALPGPWQSGPPQPAPQAGPAQSAPPPVGGEPTSAPPHQISVPPHQNSAPPYQVSGAPHQTSGPPQQVSGSPYQMSGPPYQVSGPPQPLPEMPRYPSDPATSADSSAYDPLYSPVRHIVPSAPEPRRGRLWILIGAAVVVLLASGGAVVAVVASGDDPDPKPSSTASALPELPPATNPPLQPGLEPPAGGSWPAQWPTFTERDNVRTLSNLEGVGFQVKVPVNWECTLAGRARGYVRYSCGVPAGQTPQAGGELIVRDCPQPCDETRQTAMRQAEEAWGKRWTRSGQFSTYAETNTLQEGGEQRHGLIVVAYFRGGSDGVVDRQLVLRLTAPISGANELRRVATYLRDTLIF